MLTSKKYRLSPKAIRDFYESHKDKIRENVLPYASAATRPLDWPFHERAPQDIEATAFWIYDWGSQPCLKFLNPESQARRRHSTGTIDRAFEARSTAIVPDRVATTPRRSSRLVARQSSGSTGQGASTLADVKIKEEVKIEWVYEEKPDVKATEGELEEEEDDFMSLSSYP